MYCQLQLYLFKYWMIRQWTKLHLLFSISIYSAFHTKFRRMDAIIWWMVGCGPIKLHSMEKLVAWRVSDWKINTNSNDDAVWENFTSLSFDAFLRDSNNDEMPDKWANILNIHTNTHEHIKANTYNVYNNQQRIYNKFVILDVHFHWIF